MLKYIAFSTALLFLTVAGGIGLGLAHGFMSFDDTRTAKASSRDELPPITPQIRVPKIATATQKADKRLALGETISVNDSTESAVPPYKPETDPVFEILTPLQPSQPAAVIYPKPVSVPVQPTLTAPATVTTPATITATVSPVPSVPTPIILPAPAVPTRVAPKRAGPAVRTTKAAPARTPKPARRRIVIPDPVMPPVTTPVEQVNADPNFAVLGPRDLTPTAVPVHTQQPILPQIPEYAYQIDYDRYESHVMIGVYR